MEDEHQHVRRGITCLSQNYGDAAPSPRLQQQMLAFVVPVRWQGQVLAEGDSACHT